MPDRIAAPDLTRFRHRPVGFLWRYVAQNPVGHAVVLAAVVLAVLASVMTQYGMKTLIDAVSKGPGIENAAGGGDVWRAFALLCALITADNLLWRVGCGMAAFSFVKVTGQVRRDLFAHLAGHSPSYYAERLPGTLAGRVTSTAQAMFQTENVLSWNVLPPCLAVLIAISLISSVQPLMGLTLAGISAVMAGVIFLLARRGTPHHRAYAHEAASVDGELVDVIGNMGVVRAFGATYREQARFGDRMASEMRARRRSLLYMEKLRLIHAVMTALVTAGLLGWGITLWQAGTASAGDLVLICSLGFTILHGTRDLAVALVELTQNIARMDEALGALLVPHDLPDRPDARNLIALQGDVKFTDVTFAYPGRKPVLDNFSLRIPTGQRVGLVGASGAGKSTVVSLLQRFHDVQAGHISIDGQDISALTQQSLRDTMAIVPQDISLFHRSVMENIRYAKPDATDEQVLAAANIARCRDFIEALPEGFDTMVGDRGAKLSGGQRQRLAIARALLKNSPILLLDEATSALDSDSEHAIQHALDNLMQGRTVIAVAHRLSTLRNFDRIVVMEDGRVIDDGSPDELSHRAGPYRDLLRKQMIESEDA
jgi:ATP-binding cassette subfamily B protein